MSHTNNTQYYNLPQFISSDVPGWLSDVNGAMSTTDTALHGLDTRLTTAEGKITTDEGRLTAVELQSAGDHADLAPLKTQVPIYTQDISDLKDADIALDSRLTDVEDAVTVIGAAVQEDVNDVAVANNTLTDILTATLTPGEWIVEASISWQNNSNGYRQLGLSTGSGGWDSRYTLNRCAPASGAATNQVLTAIFKVNSTVTVRLTGRQTSGGTLNSDGGLRAYRLK